MASVSKLCSQLSASFLQKQAPYTHICDICICFVDYVCMYVDCNGYDTENECIAISGCGWEDTNGYCYCASNVTIDIMFSLDSSWSVSESDFQTALNWFADYVETSLSQDARIAITNFAAEAFLELSFSESGAMSNDELKEFVEDDVPYRGNDGLGTDTYDAITITTDLFDTESKDLSTKALIILTDGKPCCTNRGQNVDVCSLTSSLTTRGIYTYIIGVGNFDVSKVDCLVDDPDNDVALIDDFDEDEFNTLLDPLGDITCPGMFHTCFAFSYFVFWACVCLKKRCLLSSPHIVCFVNFDCSSDLTVQLRRL